MPSQLIPNPPSSNPDEQQRSKILRDKGPGWNALFWNGVNDDDFKIGLLFQKCNTKGVATSKNSVTRVILYSDFYHSDIIIASPLILKFCCFLISR